MPSSTSMALLHNVPKFVHLFVSAFVFLTVIRLYLFPLLTSSAFSWRPSAPAPPPLPPPPAPGAVVMAGKEYSSKCDISKGKWVPNPNAPYYTNDTCWAIHEHHNCLKYGRPDDGFMRWRWRPDGCDLPVFNPAQFLELVRHKSLAFVGDSVGRNHMQSLLCLLLRATYAVDASPVQDENFRRYRFPSHNFTVASFWSPFLVRAQEADDDDPSGLLNLYLDEPDTSWSREIAQFDYVIISAGQPFLRPTMFYENRRLVGCHYCRSPNVTDLTKYYGYRMAFHTALRVFTDDLRGFGGTVFLRTYSPTHFEGGEWDRGGDCVRRRPFRRDEARLDEVAFQMYMTQMEEFRAAEREGRKKSVKLRLLDTTEAMLLRGDGHPGRYGHVAGANVSMYNDCVHWCLPGPIDTWNDFLLHTMKNEGRRLATRRRPGNERKPS
ncbi:protein trichome birefringence-like 19 [Zingiber officinale]|nr:protein trichome birefringence-like 19 [Zingiber officinale]